MLRKYFLLSVTLLTALPCLAGGFQVSLQGQKQTGMSHVGAALPLDGSAIYFNPGALSFVGGTHVNVGLSPIFSSVNFRQPSTGATSAKEPSVGTPFSAYISSALGKEGSKLANFSIGVGVYTPFGSGIEYPSDWVGRYVTQAVELKTIFYQPTISYRFMDKFGVGVGFVYGTGDFSIKKAIPLYDGAGEGSTTLAGKGSGIGFNLGVYAEPIKNLSVGLTYRTGTKVKITDGDATFDVPAAVAPKFTATKFDLNVGLPSTLAVGVAYFLKDDKRDFVSVQVDQTGWKSYDELRFVFTDGAANGDTELASARNYHGAFIFRLGAQKGINDKLTVRAGAYIDQSAVPDETVTPETPDSQKSGFSVGAGYQIAKMFSVDASFLYLDGKERTTTNVEANFDQTYKTRTLIPGIGLNLTF